MRDKRSTITFTKLRISLLIINFNDDSLDNTCLFWMQPLIKSFELAKTWKIAFM